MISPEVLERVHPGQPVEMTHIALLERGRSQAVRELLAAENYDARAIVMENMKVLKLLPETPYRVIGQDLAKEEPLSFEHAFLGMAYVVAATNTAFFEEVRPAIEKAHDTTDFTQNDLGRPGQSFLTAMATREALGVLTAEEIAAMVAAGMMDINHRLKVSPYVLETGGMGGDKGFMVNGEKRKVINASTLSAVVLSSLDVPIIKHGSYANTSAVGSTEAVEALGVNIFQASHAEIAEMFNRTGFYFGDAHIAKTLHDLSHSIFMRHETINHVIGPMTPPVHKDTMLRKVIGVNEGVHPSLIAQAYQILHDRGYQTVGNVLVVSGLGEEFRNGEVDIHDPKAMKQHMMLDEASPYSTLLSIVQNGEYKGDVIVTPEDFGVSIPAREITFVNTQEELLAANGHALQGLSGVNSDYLAMNAALGLFTAEYLGREDAIVDGQLNTAYLQEAFVRCQKAILSGRAAKHLEKIIAVSHGRYEEEAGEPSLLDGIDAVIFDVDDTLINPKSGEFYKRFSDAVDRAVAIHYGVSIDRAKEIADYFRAHPHYGGGEHALFGDIREHFPELAGFDPGFIALYDEMSAVDPSGAYDSHQHIVDKIRLLQERGIKVVALTDAPEALSRKLLAEAGIDPDDVFDMYIGGSRELGPHKLLRKEQKFIEIAQALGTPYDRILVVGDSFVKDIAPGLHLGMKGCYIGKKEITDYTGEKASTIDEVFERMRL